MGEALHKHDILDPDLLPECERLLILRYVAERSRKAEPEREERDG